MDLMKEIETGRKPAPRRILLYGVHGVGKSSFASRAPKAIFIQTEDGLGEIECARFPLAKTFDDAMTSLSALYAEQHTFKTIVVDTVDWLEKLIWADVCMRRGLENIEDIPYGKGYTIALTQWKQFIEGLTSLRDERGMTVLLLAHAKIERFENPETESYDRYVPRLHKLASQLLQEWTDEVLFANYKIFTKKLDEGFSQTRTQGIGSGERIIRTTERPSHVAKNRLGLPDELPLDWEAYAKFTTNFSKGD